MQVLLDIKVGCLLKIGCDSLFSQMFKAGVNSFIQRQFDDQQWTFMNCKVYT